MNESSVLWEETIHGGATWSHVLKRGTALRLTDLQGGANAGANRMAVFLVCLESRSLSW